MKRELSMIYLYLTKGCNLACKHCWIDSENATEILAFECIEKVCKEAKELGCTSIKLTGGEPFLHPEIERILQLLCDYEFAVVIESNGVLIRQSHVDILKSLPGLAISISIDSHHPTVHDVIRGQKGSFEKSIQAVKLLVSNQISPQIIMSLMAENREDIEEMALLSTSLGANSLKINLIEPTHRGKVLHENGETLGVETLIAIGQDVEERISKKIPIPIYYSQPVAFFPLSKLATNMVGYCGIKSILGVISSGEYALCGIGSHVKELCFGHVMEKTLSQAWQSPLLLEIYEDIPSKFEGVCQRCLLKGVCLGSCLAQNYYRNATLFAPYWFCEEAEAKGLFPKERQYEVL